MGDIKSIAKDLERLRDNIDDLEQDLEPLMGDLSSMASVLPLLDRVKLFSLTAYAIESLIFATIKLEGTANAQDHPVFAELKRVQQYFAKIKAAEEGPADSAAQRRTTVNQEATARVLKADLADNKSVSEKLAMRIAEQKAMALLKSVEAGDSSEAAASSTKSQNEHKKSSGRVSKKSSKSGSKTKKRG